MLVRDEVVQGLQALLDAKGSRGCQVTPHACPPGCSGAQSFICKNEGTRVCLVSQGEEHVNNNAWLSVEQGGATNYWCHAPSCKEKGPRCIGDLDPGLLEPGIFHARHRRQFFELLDVFLRSTHLPAYLVAAFVKRMARLALTAPPHGAMLAIGSSSDEKIDGKAGGSKLEGLCEASGGGGRYGCGIRGCGAS
jgi:hypothetical protein